MLDDLGITRADYNTGQTISRVGFLVAELPSQLISKRIGPDLWIPIQICIFSLIAGMQLFLNGHASFLVTRYLMQVLRKVAKCQVADVSVPRSKAASCLTQYFTSVTGTQAQEYANIPHICR
ncbi:hypothetical protein F66182_824 [Fusarium sp. NRRL 66182]|nr:hypothetical protein F66182_824 [Fusarium sp. NRRL 66182]